jgi:glutathione S-transferase
MKFYDCSTAPSPRRVRIFIAEKGLEIETVEVDLRNGEHLGPEFKAINPHCTVPVLGLDDGTCIAEIPPICRYLEEIHPEPNLMGADPTERAVIAMWDRYMELDGVMAIAEALRNRAKGMAGRALTGPVGYEQIPELAERGRKRAEQFFADLDTRLGENDYIAGGRFTVADITAYVAVEFAGWLKIAIADEQKNLRRWFDTLAARPGCKV